MTLIKRFRVETDLHLIDSLSSQIVMALIIFVSHIISSYKETGRGGIWPRQAVLDDTTGTVSGPKPM